MIYWALAIVTATSVSVADIYTTAEPCRRDARLLWQVMDAKPESVGCIPTTESDADSAEQQLNNIKIFMKRS
jgi:hypothetical protein